MNNQLHYTLLTTFLDSGGMMSVTVPPLSTKDFVQLLPLLPEQRLTTQDDQIRWNPVQAVRKGAKYLLIELSGGDLTIQ